MKREGTYIDYNRKHGKLIEIKIEDGTLFVRKNLHKDHKQHDYPKKPKPQFYHQIKEMLKTKTTITLDELKEIYPDAYEKKLVSVLSLLVKENVIRSAGKDKFVCRSLKDVE